MSRINEASVSYFYLLLVLCNFPLGNLPWLVVSKNLLNAYYNYVNIKVLTINEKTKQTKRSYDDHGKCYPSVNKQTSFLKQAYKNIKLL